MEEEGKRKEEPTLEAARSAVFKESVELEESGFLKVSGYDFNSGLDFVELFNSFRATGFQASNLGDAIALVNQMVRLVESSVFLSLTVKWEKLRSFTVQTQFNTLSFHRRRH